jgi:hypothetical protein
LFSSYWPIKLAAYFSYFSLELELELDEEELGFLEVLDSLDELLVLRVELGRQDDDVLFLVLELLEESRELEPRELR